MSQVITEELCFNGHDMTVVGKYRRPNNKSVCKKCHRDWIARSGERKRALREHDDELLPDEAARFMAKVEVQTEGCWNWTGCSSSTGYGSVTLAGRTKLAHRISYRHHIGPIPEGLEIDHLCRNKMCVNPAHLEAVDHTENVRRACQLEVCRRGHNEWATYAGGKRRYCRRCNIERHRAERKGA